MKKSGELNRKEYFQNIIDELTKKKQNIEKLISIAEMMQMTGKDFNTLSRSSVALSTADHDELFSLLAATSQAVQNFNDENFINEDISIEDLFESVMDLYDSILNDYDEGLNFNDIHVQNKLKIFHKQSEVICSESIILFQMMINIFISDELFDDVEPEQWSYLKNAIYYYCAENRGNSLDKVYFSTSDELEILYIKKYSYDSSEVQKSLDTIHNFFSNMKLISANGMISFMKQEYLSLLNTPDISKDDASFCHFIINSVDYYLNNLEKKEGEQQ